MVEEHRWSGNESETLRILKPVENIFTTEETDSSPWEGIQVTDPLYHDINAFYSHVTQPLGGRPAWFRLKNRRDRIRCYFEDKGCPFFLADEGEQIIWSITNHSITNMMV